MLNPGGDLEGGPVATKQHALLTLLLRRRRLVLVLSTLLVIGLLPGLALLETDNSPEAYFLEGSARVARYQELRELFGNDEIAYLVARGPALWTAEGLAWLDTFEREAARLPGVEDTGSLASAARQRFAAWPPADPEAMRQQAREDVLARGLGWIDEEGTAATVLIRFARLEAAEKRQLLARLESLRHTVPRGLETELVGLPVLDAALDGSSREIGRRFFPLLVVFTLVLLAVVFRDVRSIIPPLAFVALAELLVLGPMGYLGVRLNLVLAILPPLLFVIGLATAVHVLLPYRRSIAAGVAPEVAVAEVYEDKGWAILWTGITTLTGFGSLALSPVGPVRELGIWTAAGVAMMTAVAFLLYPVLLTLVGNHDGRARDLAGRDHHSAGRVHEILRRKGEAWATSAARHRRPLLAVVGLLAVLAIFGLPRLRVESNALTYLPSTHPARAGIERLQNQGVGTAVIELILTSPAGSDARAGAGEGDFTSAATLDRLAQLTARLREIPGVFGAVGAGDVAAWGREGMGNAPLTLGPGAVLAAEAMLGQALQPFRSADGQTTRILLFGPVIGYDRLEPVETAALAAAEGFFPDARPELSGQFLLLLESQRRLLRTLTLSFSITLLCVAVIFRILLGTTRLTLLALIPNLWPVLGVLGMMGWLQAPLDIATVMVASVLLGLAVDDTIHTLGHFRELAPRLGLLQAVAGTLKETAPAYILTGVILSAGFGVCALSGFAPTARFGQLSAAGIALAVLGDLFLLPALLGSTPGGAMAKLRRPSRPTRPIRD